jgi:hypothetical protein
MHKNSFWKERKKKEHRKKKKKDHRKKRKRNIYNITRDPSRLRTGAMLILNCFSTLLCMLYTYKTPFWITLSMKKNYFKIRWVVLKIYAYIGGGKWFCFICYDDSERSGCICHCQENRIALEIAKNRVKLAASHTKQGQRISPLLLNQRS